MLYSYKRRGKGSEERYFKRANYETRKETSFEEISQWRNPIRETEWRGEISE
jgi:hypothetical protein